MDYRRLISNKFGLHLKLITSAIKTKIKTIKRRFPLIVSESAQKTLRKRSECVLPL